MKEYLATLFGVCLLSAIVRVITPENATKKYIEILCSLCVVAAMVLPVIKQISSAQGIDEVFEGIEYDTQNYEEIYNSYIIDSNIKMAEQTLAEELEAYFEVESGSIGITLVTETLGTEVNVSIVKATLTAKSIAVSPDELAEYVRQRVGAECQIIYDKIDK